jgi:acyl carrier protein
MEFFGRLGNFETNKNMQKTEIEAKLKDIFKKRFPLAGIPDETTSSADVNGWDSLNHIVLITDIESEFNVKFSLEDMLSMQSFGEILKALESKV